MNIMLVMIGGALGALFRYAVSTVLLQRLGGGFAWGTSVVNIAGCFLIGIAAGFSERLLMPRALWLLLVTGFLGGFTTFSTFSLETVTSLRGGDNIKALLNIGVNLAGGIAATVLGLYFSLSSRPR
jgi:fluoride exporter